MQLLWMNPSDPQFHKPMYDTSLCASELGGIEARRLMSKAFEEALTLQQQQHLLAQLEKDPKLVYHVGLTPNKVSMAIIHQEFFS